MSVNTRARSGMLSLGPSSRSSPPSNNTRLSQGLDKVDIAGRMTVIAGGICLRFMAMTYSSKVIIQFRSQVKFTGHGHNLSLGHRLQLRSRSNLMPGSQLMARSQVTTLSRSKFLLSYCIYFFPDTGCL